MILVTSPDSKTRSIRSRLSRTTAQDHLTSAGVAGFAPSTIGYDALGNPSSMVDALGETQIYTYGTALNRLTSWQDAMNNAPLTAMTRAAICRHHLCGRIEPAFTYDAQGNIASSEDQSGQTTTYSHDNRGLLLQEEPARRHACHLHLRCTREYGQCDGRHGTTPMTYDSADRLAEIDNPEGQIITYTYDSGGRETRRTRTASSSMTPTIPRADCRA